MPIRFRIDPITRCVHATGEEPLTDGDLRQYQLDLAAHPDHGPGFDQLVDLRAVGALGITALGIRTAGRLSDHFAEQVRGTRCAVVVASEVAYGLARMFVAFSSESVEFQVFRDFGAARAWLGLV